MLFESYPVIGKIARRAGVNAGAGLTLCLLLFLWESTHIDRSKLPANEASAIGSLRTIWTANTSYAADHPEQVYAKNLVDLSTQGLLGPVFASGVREGYKLTYISHSSSGTGRFEKYEVFADPLKPGRAGWRHFFVDESGGPLTLPRR
jgi:hypothetical protein